MATPRWTNQRIAVTSGAWTAITPPSAMDYMAFRCDTSALTIRTDVNDAGGEDTVAQGVQQGVLAARTYGTFRFEPGVTACVIKSQAASATVLITWVL